MRWVCDRNLRKIYQTMGLDADVQACHNKIERLSQPQTPVVSRRGFWAWWRRLWRWLRAWFGR
jgi:heme oxygenase